MISMSAMTPDLWLLAAFAFLCSFGVAAFGIAEGQRFTDPRPAARHRRRLSTSEKLMEAREIIYNAGYVFLGLGLLVAVGFRFLLDGLHQLDAWRERRFYAEPRVELLDEVKA